MLTISAAMQVPYTEAAHKTRHLKMNQHSLLLRMPQLSKNVQAIKHGHGLSKTMPCSYMPTCRIIDLVSTNWQDSARPTTQLNLELSQLTIWLIYSSMISESSTKLWPM